MPEDYLEQLLTSRKIREPGSPPSYDELTVLKQSYKRLERKFDSLLAIMKLYGESDSFESNMRALVEYGQNLIPFEAIELMKLDETEEHLILYSVCYEGKIKWGEVLKFKGTEMEDIVKQRRISLVRNLQEEPEFPVSDLVHMYDILSILQIPITSTEQFWGFLNFYHRKPNIFQEAHFEFAQYFSILLSFSFDKALLKERVNYFKKANTVTKTPNIAISRFLKKELDSIQGKIVEKCVAMGDKKFGKIGDKQKEMIDEIKDFAELTKRKLEHLEEFLLISSGQVVLDRRKLDLSRTISDVLEKMKAKIDWRSIRVLFEIDKKFPPVIADFKILQRILVAIIENSVEASKHGAVIRINVSEDGGAALIAISNFGECINPLDFERIFTPFSSIEYTLTPKRGKMILNLPIVKILIELLEGKIWIESEKDVDTTFFFTLPLAK